jgi:hypothetical protein
LQVALDVSSDGQLQLPPYPSNPTSAIWNITIFLSSYVTGWNFTISNGTASSGNASLGEIMAQEPGSTVKHVNWVWPDCLVGNGPPGDNTSSARGLYNVCFGASAGVESWLTRVDLHTTEFPFEWNGRIHNLRSAHPSHKFDPCREQPAFLPVSE